MKIRELAKMIGGAVEGDGNIDINGVSGVETAKSGDMAFALNEERLSGAEKSNVSCVLTNKTIRKSTKTLIRVTNPKLSFLISSNILNVPPVRESFIHPTAVVSDKAHLGKGVWIGSGVSIEEGVIIGDHVIIESNSVIKKNCEMGSFCHIHPNVTLYENTILQKNVILHSGVVAGSDGFGYVKDNGSVYKFPQLGKVIIRDNVEIGANTTIDKGSLSDTIIDEGTKIDNLCQIAHNVKIGKNMLMAAQCGISGSTTVGNNVTIGGQAGIADNVTIGNDVIIGAKSAVIGNVKSGAIVWGIPARPIAQTKRQMAVLSWITKNFKKISRS
ncbi:MAG: UDP-3-O-(3-hydroxymyristoyl)glucosamine N-acyltransferase [Candidatus Omnitrophica bacterium]|nr:UDP-3-O-(3-hydroxymyristoyl)glucosamine N-acyltransferase [Candidatus Omnitrophota bacterium]